MEQYCEVCGEPAVTYFGGIPLCPLQSCKVAVVEEINKELNAAAEAAKEYK